MVGGFDGGGEGGEAGHVGVVVVVVFVGVEVVVMVWLRVVMLGVEWRGKREKKRWKEGDLLLRRILLGMGREENPAWDCETSASGWVYQQGKGLFTFDLGYNKCRYRACRSASISLKLQVQLTRMLPAR